MDRFRRSGKVASFLCVRPNLSYHFVSTDAHDLVESVTDVSHSQLRINGGYFIFRKEVFQYIRDRQELLHEPILRVVKVRNDVVHNFDGLWLRMDTLIVLRSEQ